MDLLRTQLIEELRAAREELLDINFADFTPETHTEAIKPDFYRMIKRDGVIRRPYDHISRWLDKWDPTFRKLKAMHRDLHRGPSIDSKISEKFDVYQKDTNVEIFNAIRPIIVGFLDDALNKLDEGYKVEPLLEDYTKRVKSPKLSVLLKEFNTAKDTAPNLAAIGYRTILCLIIQERAKIVAPSSQTATRTDLAPTDVLRVARNEHILSDDQDRLIKSFESTHKEIADLITHRPDVIANKRDVEVMVDLLNRLLPAIIN